MEIFLNKTIFDEHKNLCWSLERWNLQESNRKWPYYFSPSKNRVYRCYREKRYDHTKYCYDYHLRIISNKISDRDFVRETQTYHFPFNQFDDDLAREKQITQFPIDRYEDRGYSFNPDKTFVSLPEDAIPFDLIVERSMENSV